MRWRASRADGVPGGPPAGPSPPERSRAEAFLAWLVSRGRVPYLLVISLLTAVLGVFAFRIPIDVDNVSMISTDAEQRRIDDTFRRSFGGDDDLFLSVTRPRLLSREGLRYLAELTAWVGRQDGVRRVYSLANARRAVPGPDGAESAPVVPTLSGGPDFRDRIEASLGEVPKLAGLLVSRDRGTAGITIEVADRPGDALYRARLIHTLRERIARDAGTAELRLTGISVMKNDVAEFVRRDKSVLLPLSALVLATGLALAFRRVIGIVIPMAVKGISLAWTLGLYSLAGYSLNPITALLPPLIVVISISTCVHLYGAWLETPAGSPDRAAAIVRQTGDLLRPCFGTAAATALGLLALTVSDTPAVRQFGVFGALGVLISFFTGITLMPVALSYLPLPSAGDRKPGPGRSGFTRLLEGAARLCTVRAPIVLGVALAAALAGLAGTFRVRNNTDLVRFLKPETALYRDTMFIDARFPGVYSLDFTLSRRDGRPMTSPSDLRRIAAFEAAAEGQAGVGDAYSIADVISPLHAAESGRGSPGLPDTEEQVQNEFDLLRADRSQPFLSRLMSADLTRARVSVRVHAVGTAYAAPLSGAILRAGRGLLGDSYLAAPAGSFHRVVQDSSRLVRKALLAISLSLLAIVAAVHALLRSARLSLSALVPALLPPLLAGGLMGLFGIDLSTGTAMVGPVVLGQVADGTIHFLYRYRKESAAGAREAIARTVTGAGWAISASSLILAFGFGVGAFGSFLPTVHFSLLAGGTMLAALACLLLVLPAFLSLRAPAREGAVR